MNKKLLEILESIRQYQDLSKNLAKIDSEKDSLQDSSEYNEKVNELLKELNSEGVFITSDKPYDELLKEVEKQVNDRIAKPITSYYDENEIQEAYGELSEEEKNKYGNYDNFKNTILTDFEKEIKKGNEKLKEILEKFKNLEGSYDNVEIKQQELDNERIKLLNDRWSLLQTKLKNVDIKLLESGIEYQKGLPVIKDDMEMIQKVPKLDADNISLDDLIMVHATRYFPENGIVKSTRDAIGNNRNTIHTALNGKVSSHNYGNWEDCGIVVLDPLKEHIDQVECIYSVDTFTYGSMKLSDEALILIDSSKYNEFYEQNKEYIERNKDRIILYSGNSTIIVERLLGMLGYAPQKIGQWGWENKYNTDKLNEFAQKNYPNKLNTAHNETAYSSVEKGFVREEALSMLGIKDDGNDMIISPEVLYSLRKSNEQMPTKQFIVDVGIFVNDNEIHLLGIKDHIDLMRSNEVSQFQIEKVDLLVKKYELMLHLQNEEQKGNQR